MYSDVVVAASLVRTPTVPTSPSERQKCSIQRRKHNRNDVRLVALTGQASPYLPSSSHRRAAGSAAGEVCLPISLDVVRGDDALAVTRFVPGALIFGRCVLPFYRFGLM